MAVPPAVTAEKSHPAAAQASQEKGIRGVSERRFEPDLAEDLHALDLIQTGPPQDADLRRRQPQGPGGRLPLGCHAVLRSLSFEPIGYSMIKFTP